MQCYSHVVLVVHATKEQTETSLNECCSVPSMAKTMFLSKHAHMCFQEFNVIEVALFSHLQLLSALQIDREGSSLTPGALCFCVHIYPE